jgi:HPt (histidine-containing phosphotransfer) domain-containing protein
MLGSLRAAIERGDPAAVEQAAHKLKSSVGNFFAEEAHRAASELEIMGRNGDLSRAGAAHTALQSAMRALQPALEALVRGDGR